MRRHRINSDKDKERMRAYYANNRSTILASQKLQKTTTINGLLTKMLGGMKRSSVGRGHSQPCFNNRSELSNWLFSNVIFDKMWLDYCASGFIKKLRPSIDRLDNSVGYTIENIRLVTWKENSDAWYLSIAGRSSTRNKQIGRRARFSSL